MPKLQLSQILGNSSHFPQQIGYAQDCLIYISGSFLIFYNPIVDQQISYLQHSSPVISCIAVSKCQKYLAVCSTPLEKEKEKTLESIGKKNYSNITIYSLEQIGVHEPKVQIVLKGHKYAIDFGLFSPDGKYFVSISNRDGSMFTWDIGTGDRTTQNKNTKPINCLKFTQNPQGPLSLLTVSRGICKVWQFSKSWCGALQKQKEEEQYILTGHTLNLSKKLATKQFIDINFYQQYIILLTSDGLLCLVNGKEGKLEKCIDLMISKIRTMDVLADYVICGGENAVVKIVDLQALVLVGKFPKPPPVRKENVEKDTTNEEFKGQEYSQGEQFPFCTCVKTIGSNKFSQFVVTIYQNNTLFVWRPDPSEMLAMRSIISHQGPIPLIKILQQLQNNLTFFSTVGSDSTIRIWHIYNRCIYNRESIDIGKLIGIKRNAYCRNLTRIIYLDGDGDGDERKIKQKDKGVDAVDADDGGRQQITCKCICGWKGKYVAVGIRAQFLVYQLAGFQIWAYQPLEAQAIQVQIVGDLAYLGLSNGKIVVYQIVQKQGKLHKIRQIQLNNRIKIMHVLQNKTQLYLAILTQQSQQLLIYQLNKSKITHIQKHIKHIAPCPSPSSASFSSSESSQNLLTCTKDTISLFWPTKQKQSYLLSLKHELSQAEFITAITTNSIWIVCTTNLNRIIVANYSPAIVLTKQFSQNITDIKISQNGQFIIVGQFGNIMVWIMHGLQTYGDWQDQVKKWVGKDLSWMDGSVWANRKSSNRDSGVSRLPGDVVDSIRLKSSVNRDSIRLELPNMDIKYKTQQNDQSIFNPSHILRQAKQIYKNIDVIEKKINNNSNVNNQKQAEKGEKIQKGKSANQKGRSGSVQHPTQEEQSLEEIQFSRNKIKGKPPLQQSLTGKGSKKRIFGLKLTQNKNQHDISKQFEQQVQQGLPEQFRNNLVSSIIHQIPKDDLPPPPAQNPLVIPSNNFSEFQQQNPKGQVSVIGQKSNYAILQQKQSLFELAQKIQKQEQFVLNHGSELEKIYDILAKKMGKSNKNIASNSIDRSAVIQQFNIFSQQFNKFLETGAEIQAQNKRAK